MLLSLDGVHDWLNIIKQQLVALAESFEVFIEMPCCHKSSFHAQSVMGLLELCFTDDIFNGSHITSGHLSQGPRQAIKNLFFL